MIQLRAIRPQVPDMEIAGYDRAEARARVEAATGYECDNTVPLEGPLHGESEITEERRLDGRRRRRVTSCRVSSAGVAAWMWRQPQEDTDGS